MDRKIKIAYLHAGAEMYGADRVLLELVSLLDKETFLPMVILPEKGPLFDELRKRDVNTIIIPYPILRRKYFNVKGVLSYIHNYRKYSKKILQYVKANKIDVLHVNTSAVLEGIYVRKRTRIKLVWHVHEILRKPRIIAKVIRHFVLKYADRIVCVSKATKKNLDDGSKKNISVIYNGVDNSIFHSGIDTSSIAKELNNEKDDIKIGMIGRINAWKGQKDFIDAIDYCSSNNSHIKGYMFGGVFDGQEWRIADLKSYIDSKSSNNISLYDFRNDTAVLYNYFDIFVLPSTEPDPLPTVVLEAMACGKPIVGYRHGGICEMVVDGGNGILVEPNNVRKLSEAIGRLAADKKMMIEYGKNSMVRQKELFSLEKYITNFEKIYKEVYSGK